MLTAATLILRAAQNAQADKYLDQGLDFLNSILSDLCEKYDLALARQAYQFNFNPSLSTMFGSGPYPLPLDYLRTSGSSGARGASRSAWYLYPTPTFPQGQPIFMVPIDLAEFDQFPQFPNQSTPELWATDMGGPLAQRITLSTTALLTSGSTSATIPDGTAVAVGTSMAGEAIQPGTTVTAKTGTPLTTTGDTHSNTTVDNIPSTTGLVAGMYAQVGSVLTTIAVVVGPTSVTLTDAATTTATGVQISFYGSVLTLSLAPIKSIAAASVFFGTPPVAYVYPPPLGTYPVTVRYQAMKPPITDTSQIPWFPDEGYLLEELTARLMWQTSDQRQPTYFARAKDRLREYLDLKDDNTNRSQQVQLDLRNYGGGTAYDRARNTKVAGW